ncbi:hypothetical protein PRIPAC_76746 [Pristionchus pacificus]|uniref:Nuclear receptor n=1 Tax=Pristionchus pacificus TaxID=54126 RepID=A0A454XMD7_PRIPA|nr:hypothetical protein PRIPAC_76746 [Pristionchus pacificus]|eukprot:PDM79412.1 nuclear receptor [Pristionchus pacificus]
MSTKRPAKPKKRFGDCQECLVCGGKTISAHLGMNVCRACSVFYRRSVGKRVYECRSNTGKCEVSKGATCRKCRFERIERLLATSGEGEGKKSTDDSSPDSLKELEGDADHTHRCEASSSSSANECATAQPRQIVERIRSSYKTMCQIRLTSELLIRPDPPHPLLMNEDDCPYAQATFGTMQSSNRILLTSILGFGKSAFPELADLSKQLQWTLAVNFLYRFGPFESSYRADKLFPQYPDRIFAGFTYWLTHNYDEHYFSDCPNPIDKEHVMSSMHNHCKTHHTNFRTFMRRLKLTETEFLYLSALLFWTTDNLDVPDTLSAIAAQHRAAIMQELHVYFKEELRMDNYAARLGELLTAIQMFDKIDAVKENFEFLRLVNVFSEDSFVYRVLRDEAPQLDA